MRKRKLAYRLRRAARRAHRKLRIQSARELPALERAVRRRSFEQQLMTALWGGTGEPSWVDIRKAAQANMTNATVIASKQKAPVPDNPVLQSLQEILDATQTSQFK